MACKRVDQITPFDVASWRDEQALKSAPGTVLRRLGAVGGFFSYCRTERGWITANPCASVRKPRVNDARDRILSDDERRYLMAAAGTSRAGWLADVLVVLLQSAMRRGELWGLQRTDVDYPQAVVHLAESKTGARDVPCCPLTLVALRRLDAAAEQRGSEALVPLSDPHAVSVAFRRTIARARSQYINDCSASGVKADAGFLADFRLHDCRHAAASMWAQTGSLSVFELQQVTGHKTLSMLGRYVNLKSSTLAAKLAIISA
jgi:integrase